MDTEVHFEDDYFQERVLLDGREDEAVAVAVGLGVLDEVREGARERAVVQVDLVETEGQAEREVAQQRGEENEVEEEKAEGQEEVQQHCYMIMYPNGGDINGA